MEIKIPKYLKFADLDITRDPETLELEFNISPLEVIAKSSGITLDQLGEEGINQVIIEWYKSHLEQGGKMSFVMEQIKAELEAENKYGALVMPSPGMKQ